MKYMRRPLPFFVSGACVLAVATGLFFIISPSCAPIATAPFTHGSHGYRVWSGPTLKSFEHEIGRTCIPKGWQAVGAVETGAGWATFAPAETGVAIASPAFASSTLSFEHSAYAVTLIYPKSATPEQIRAYELMVRNAFETVGALFNDSALYEPSAHTVLVTAGLGASKAEKDSVYPDPNGSVTYLILTPDHPRAEELLIHAVAHLYNRFSLADLSYETMQAPVPQEDWQELEAAWAETAYESSSTTRRERFDYLYRVHQAVTSGDFSRVHEPPFDTRNELSTTTPGIVMNETSTQLDEQYGHYVLAPLAMTALDGIFFEDGASTSVASLLSRVHEGGENFFDLIQGSLSASRVDTFMSWLNGSTPVPHALVQKGETSYDR